MKKIILLLAIIFASITITSANVVIYGGCVASSTNGTTVKIYCGDKQAIVCVFFNNDATYGCSCPGGCPLHAGWVSYREEPAPPGANYTEAVIFEYE